jgi:hypothetical protein
MRKRFNLSLRTENFNASLHTESTDCGFIEGARCPFDHRHRYAINDRALRTRK